MQRPLAMRPLSLRVAFCLMTSSLAQRVAARVPPPIPSQLGIGRSSNTVLHICQYYDCDLVIFCHLVKL